MTSSYHLILPLPAGRKPASPTTGLLSVMFVPRLQAIGRLADWTRDWSNWPRVITGTAPGPPAGGPSAPALQLAVGVQPPGNPFGFSPANSALSIASPNWMTPDPSPAAWSAVFGTGSGSVVVKRFRPQLREASSALGPMYDAGQVASLLRDFHRKMALDHPSAPPSQSQLASIPGYSTLTSSGDLDDYEAHMAPLGDGDVSGEETPEDADFHQSIAYLSAHPELLRLLGLVVDLEVTIPAAGLGPFKIVVESNFEAFYPLGKTVPVVVDVDADFWPLGADGPGRWATIGDGSHRVESLDISAGVAALDGIAGTAADPAATAPAPLQSAGLYVTRAPDDLVAELDERWTAQDDFERDVGAYLGLGIGLGTPPRVFAEPEILVVGRRYDVFDESAGRWFSLWDRVAPAGFSFPRNKTLVVPKPAPDEGWMTYTAFTEMASAIVDGPGDPNPDPNPNPNPNPDGPRPGGGPYKIAVASPQIDNTRLRVSPIVFSWKGWSNVADPPGRGFSGVAGPIDPKPNEPTAAMPVQVVVDYDVPNGVLPRLRYTHRYKFRARIVDVAGNSRALAETHPGGLTETPLIRFGRTSPLGAPVPMRRVPRPIPGWGDTTTTMVIKSELLQADGTVAPTSRLLFPPQTDQYQCELHGYPLPTDALFRDQATYDMFVARTATSVDAHATADPVTSELLSDPQAAWRTDVEYLGEPAASGFAFAELPGSTGAVVANFAAGTNWPASHAIGFELRAGSGAPTVVPASSTQATVTAYVPKGVTRTIRASIAGRADLADHWAMLQDRGAAFAGLQASFVNGQHWMLSVPQPITLVHAVRRPMSIPAISPGLTADRDLASSQCRFSGTFLVDRKSTGSVEVTGTWTDTVDDGPPRTTTRLLFTQQILYAETTSAAISPAPFEIGDTKRHDAELSLVAFSRYARYFTERATIRFTAPNQSVPLYTPPLVRNDGIDPMNVVVRSGPLTAVEGRDYTVDAAAGTIRRLGSTLPLNTDIEVDFLRLPITRRSDEAAGATFPVTIPNSAVPDALLVAAVLPAFSREFFSEGGDDVGVFHQGQTVRVWVRRPWFTTGNGELLGVLVGESADGPLNEIARDAMSPVGPQAPITVDDFPNAVETRTSLPGHPGVGVAGHEVRFDATRNLWFADISISADLGYRPFVKLALVRFQPESVDGAFVSEPIITEPIRLGATRTTYIIRDGTDVDVSVVGYELRNEMTAQFQAADPDISDPDLRWTDIGAPVVLAKTLPGGSSDQVDWRATMALPVNDARPIRLVIEDAERLTQQTSSGAQLVDSIAYVEALAVPAAWTAPPATTPGAPESVTATPQNQAVTVTWSPPATDGGSAVSSYTVERRSGVEAWGNPIDVAAPTTTLLVGGLTNGTQYGFRVRATNAAGSGPWSPRVDATPTPSAPAKMDTLQAQGGHRAALLRWDPPADNGSIITGYRVERREGTGAWGNGVDLSATQTRHIARGLTNGVSYEFRARASSALGDGPWSDPAAATPDVMTPGRVRQVSASSGIESATVRWRGASDRGSAILRYRVQRRQAGSPTFGAPVIVDAAETSIEITGLAAGSSWEFRVRAENAVGDGAYSSPAAVTISSTVAEPGQVVGVAVAPGNATLTVTWPEPTDGGSPIVEYELQRKSSSTLLWPALAGVTVPGDQLVFTYAGLTNGTSYDVRVRALNAVGEGPWSLPATGSPAP